MPFTVTMPKLSPTMEDGTIVAWHKKEGDYVEAGELLVEVATDKATIEYNALDEGYLRKIIAQTDAAVAVNQPIALFTVEKDESIEGFELPKEVPVPAVAEKADSAPQATQPKSTSGSIHQPSFIPEAPLTDYRFEEPRGDLSERLKASPLARRVAKEKGLDLTTVQGSGPGGRIVSNDLNLAQPDAPVTFGRRERPTIAPGTYSEQKLTPIRKVISQRLQEAKTFIPHFYVEIEVDAAPLANLRLQLKEVGLKPSVNDYIIRACALSLREHPEVNSCFNTENQTIVNYETIDISIAVGLPEGLITPIIRHADYKNLGEIHVEMKQLIARAKEGKLEPQEYKGGSFTISNLGMYGIKNFQAIINPPQAAILAVSGVHDLPVIENGLVVPGKRMSLCLSADHRVVDGVLAAEFLQTLKRFVENPASLLI